MVRACRHTSAGVPVVVASRATICWAADAAGPSHDAAIWAPEVRTSSPVVS